METDSQPRARTREIYWICSKNEIASCCINPNRMNYDFQPLDLCNFIHCNQNPALMCKFCLETDGEDQRYHALSAARQAGQCRFAQTCNVRLCFQVDSSVHGQCLVFIPRLCTQTKQTYQKFEDRTCCM